MNIAFDPLRLHDLRDPYPTYRALRDHAPVQRSDASGVWCVARYDDVQFVLRNPELFSSRAMFTMLMNHGHDGMPPLNLRALLFIVRLTLRTRMNPLEFAKSRTLIADDGERHAQMRSIVNRGFTPRRIAAWESRGRAIVRDCMARLRSGAPFDVMRDLAVPLPVTLIAEMLGVEPERRADFKRWSDAFIDHMTGPGRADPWARSFQNALIELTRYVQRVARARRKAPADDLVSAIVASQDGALALLDREIVQFVVLLLVAGNETTTNLIGNAVMALLDHPDALERVARDPALVPQAVEETLRYDAPIQLVFRTATRDVEIAGTRIPAGSIVAPLLGSANRDERRFADPDRYDLDRDTNGQLGFGHGEHFCLGASLARLEARIALEALAPELPGRTREADPARIDSFLVRGPSRLPLSAAG